MTIDFSIIGAPKCGTTSIAYYLSHHPAVDFSSIKEPFYYNTRTPAFNGVRDSEVYYSLFKNDGRLRGEGTTWYLYSNEAVSNILRENAEAKFIICLRNPVDAVVSWHAHMRLVGAEAEKDLSNAWDLTDIRLSRPTHIPVYGDVCMLDYKNLYNYGDQLEKLLSICRQDQVHIIKFDYLCNSPSLVYEETLDFLGLQHDGRTEFPVQYPRVDTKSVLLRYIGSRFSYATRIKITMYANKIGLDLYDLYFRLNTSKSVKKNIPDILQHKIASHYSQQLKKLKLITGIEF